MTDEPLRSILIAGVGSAWLRDDGFGGEVEKFMGDGIMATFNSRGDQPDHAMRAAGAALALQERMSYLADANPGWPRGVLVDMMKMHLTTTTAEVVARLHGDWEADVRAYDAVYAHILKMADALSEGIVRQFPERFTLLVSQPR